MNERTDHVLDAIDGCLTDYGMSSDAMRWNPAAAEEEDLAFLNPPCQDVSLAGHHRREAAWRLGIDVARDTPGPISHFIVQRDGGLLVVPLFDTVRAEVLRRMAAEVGREIAQAFFGVGEAARRAADALRGLAPALEIPAELPSGQVRVPDRPLPLPRNHAGPPSRRRAPRTIGTVHTRSHR